MYATFSEAKPLAQILSLPAGESRNAGLNELARRYQRQLELYVRCELESTRWSQFLDPLDLVQSLYLKLLTVEPQEQIGDEKHLMNWLQCVLRNHMLEKAKALKARKRDVSRVKPLLEDLSPETGPAVGAHEDRRPGVSPRAVAPPAESGLSEDHTRFRELLGRVEQYLDPADWDLFRRHHLEDVPQAELARELDRTPGAVCQRLKRICASIAGRFTRYADLFEAN